MMINQSLVNISPNPAILLLSSHAQQEPWDFKTQLLDTISNGWAISPKQRPVKSPNPLAYGVLLGFPASQWEYQATSINPSLNTSIFTCLAFRYARYLGNT